MKTIRNFLLAFFFFFLLINFFYDLSIIRNFFNKNQHNIINKYLFPYKNINELEKEIETVQKESNLFRGQKNYWKKHLTICVKKLNIYNRLRKFLKSY